jgi:hypothetical protein
MTTRNRTPGARTAEQAFASQAAAFEGRLKELAEEFETLKEGHHDNPRDWGYVGTLDYWNEKLAEILGEEF